MATNRRGFLKTGLGGCGILSLGATAPGFLLRAAIASAPREDKDTVLVVLNLPGGNDGLNTVVPHQDDHYGRNRSTLRLKSAEVLPLPDGLGLHPKMAGFRRLFDDGRISIVQGVGYPKPRGDHDESMRVWQAARAEGFSSEQTGWLGRTVDRVAQADRPAMRAVFVGEGRMPFALSAEKTICPAIHRFDRLVLRGTAPARAIGPAVESDNGLLRFIRGQSDVAAAVSRKVEPLVASQDVRRPEYPRFQLAAKLQSIADLIRADLGVRVFFTDLGGGDIGGFDTHAGQRDNHAALLEQLSESVAGFAADLARDRLLDRVLLMTFSEFGRTLYENGRRGTDHGSAAPVFLVGGKVQGGLVGKHPSLTELENNGPKHHTDFRRVYATVLDRWLGWDSQAVLGPGFAPLEILKG